jgi:hypothetical protein
MTTAPIYAHRVQAACNDYLDCFQEARLKNLGLDHKRFARIELLRNLAVAADNVYIDLSAEDFQLIQQYLVGGRDLK